MKTIRDGGGDCPQARQDGLLAERVDHDLVIYDEQSQMAHCLSSDAALVWDQCDGRRSRTEIASELKLELETVDRALDELDASGLLTVRRGYSRRDFGKRAAAVGGAAMAAPLLYSVAVPGAAAACSNGSCGTQNPGTYTDWNPVPAGDYVWFNSRITGIGAGTTAKIELDGATITFTAGGVNYDLNVPDSVVNISPGASASIAFSTPVGHPNGLWTITSPPADEVFLSGLTLQAPAGGLTQNPKGWDWFFPLFGTPGIAFSFNFGAAAYINFGAPDAAGYNGLGVCVYHGQFGGDHAGTPENYTQAGNNVQGGSGGGGSNWTGSNSATGNCSLAC